MKKKLHKLFIGSFLLLALNSFSQNQVYWREGFEPGQTAPAVSCDLTTTNPSAAVSYYFNGNAGVWYGKNVYRTTGTGCPTGNNHVRYRNISGVTDSGYLVTPIVSAGIMEFHMYRARASRSYTIWITNDTLATTTNWTPLVLMKSSAATITCQDTMVPINSATAKRLKIVGRPGTDTDVDSIWLTSFSAITPVKFGAVSAIENNNVVRVNWSIETEINASSYIIERSINGDAYAAIGSLNPNKMSAYNWVDNTAAKGTNYYRIKVIDKDGSFQYSSVVKINVGKALVAGLAVFPNPVKNGEINLQLSGINKGEYVVRVYSLTGNLIHNTTIKSEGSSLSKSIILPTGLSNGMYSLEVSNQNFKTNKLISVH